MDHSTDKSSEITITPAKETMVVEVCYGQDTMKKKLCLHMVCLRMIL